MATARDLVTAAFEACGALGRGESIHADDASMALARLNRMLDLWSTERLSVYEEFDESLTLNGASSYSSASLASTARPVRVTDVRATLNSIDYPVSIIDAPEYNGIANKSIQGDPPRFLYPQMGMAAATFYFWPVPTQGTAKLTCTRALPSTLTLDTSISLPPGYQKAIIDSLALELCRPLTGSPPDGYMVDQATKSKAQIQRANRRPLMAADHGLPFRRANGYDINVD